MIRPVFGRAAALLLVLALLAPAAAVAAPRDSDEPFAATRLWEAVYHFLSGIFLASAGDPGGEPPPPSGIVMDPWG